MAAISISMLALLLLMPAVTPGLSTESEESLDHTATVLTALKQVVRALECFGNTVQEGFDKQRQNSDALTDLHTLSATVLRVEETIHQHDETFQTLKRNIEDTAKVGDLQRLLDDNNSANKLIVAKLDHLQDKFDAKFKESEQNSKKVGDLQTLLDDKTLENERIVAKMDDLQKKFDAKSKESEQNLKKVEAFSKENENLKNQLHNKNQTVGDLQRLLDDKTSENERIVAKVQDLGRNLDESRRNADNLQLLLQKLNNTLESEKKDVPECAEQPQQKIKDLVLQYNVSRDWPTLKRGLEAVMDQSSEAYSQLKKMSVNSEKPRWDMGYHGYTQLVTLLLCTGMPVNSTGDTKYTLLHAAARGGHYELVKVLLSRGADVNARSLSSFTPLISAAIRGDLEIVKILVQAGADTTAAVSGYNALDYARKHGHTAVQRYLEQFPV